MNIAIFASAFYPHVGGVEELVRQLAHEYNCKGHHVVVLTNRWPRDLPIYEVYEGIPVYRLAMRVPDGSVKAHVNARLTGSMIRRRMINILKREKIDVIHIQCVSHNGVYALHAAQTLGVPLVLTTQGERTIDTGRLYQRSQYMNDQLRLMLNHAAYVSACSRDTLTELLEWYGDPMTGRSGVIYNGIRVDDFESVKPYEHPRPYILGIGRVVPNKGFEILIKAIAKCKGKDFDLIIAGDGPELPRLREMVDTMGMSDRIHLIGHADRKTAVRLFKGCLLFTLPSLDEPQGIVVLEAMAANKAVIATNVGGVSEIVRHGDTGLLVNPGDPQAIASAIDLLNNDCELRLQLSLNAYQQAELFDWSILADRYLQVYANACHRAGKAVDTHPELVPHGDLGDRYSGYQKT